MGMFDYVRSSYDLGEEFTNVLCQTKGIEDGIGGTMTSYWIDPAGRLWSPSYEGTNDLKILEEGDPEYNDKLLFLNYKWVPTGKHGRYYVMEDFTKDISIYPANWKGAWEDWPTIKITFLKGLIYDYERITIRQRT